jgi:hypothetical protein
VHKLKSKPETLLEALRRTTERVRELEVRLERAKKEQVVVIDKLIESAEKYEKE